MDLQYIISRVKGILLNPKEEWAKIKVERRSNKELILNYVLPFAGLAAAISLIFIWWGTYVGFGISLRYAIMQLVSPIVAIAVAAVVMNELAETFDSTKDLNRAFKLVTYSYTPVLLINVIVSFSLALGWLGIFGLYGAYLLWVGLPIIMDTPEDKRLVYIIATLVIVLVIQLIIGAIFGLGQLHY